MLKTYYPTINFLRGVAALMVCTVHFSTFDEGNHGRFFEERDWFFQVGQHGYLGVFIFFVLSGFVIALSMDKHQYTFKKMHFFLARRWLRIELPYLIAVGLVICVAILVALKNQETYVVEWGRLGHHLSYTTTFFGYEWYSPIYWTLAIEMQFYIAIAVLFPLLNNTRHLVGVLSVLILASTALFIGDIRLLFHYLPMFGQGILLYLLLKREKGKQLFALLGILCCVLFTGFTANWAVAIVTLLSTLSIALVNVDWKFGNFFGKISYSLYLTHGIAINLLYIFASKVTTMTSKIMLFFAVFAVAIGIAFLFWRLIEAPSQKLSKRIRL